MQWLYILFCAYSLMIDDYLWELLLLKVSFSEKGVYVYVWGVSFCGYAFLTWLLFSMKRDHENIFRFISILF